MRFGLGVLVGAVAMLSLVSWVLRECMLNGDFDE